MSNSEGNVMLVLCVRYYYTMNVTNVAHIHGIDYVQEQEMEL